MRAVYGMPRLQSCATLTGNVANAPDYSRARAISCGKIAGDKLRTEFCDRSTHAFVAPASLRDHGCDDRLRRTIVLDGSAGARGVHSGGLFAHHSHVGRSRDAVVVSVAGADA